MMAIAIYPKTFRTKQCVGKGRSLVHYGVNQMLSNSLTPPYTRTKWYFLLDQIVLQLEECEYHRKKAHLLNMCYCQKDFEGVITFNLSAKVGHLFMMVPFKCYRIY
jgi:hypothetical protein